MNQQEWKDFLSEQVGQAGGLKELGYEADCILLYDKEVRKQKYVLNSIREIVGVRIVSVVAPTAPRTDKLESVGIRIKFTPTAGTQYEVYITALKKAILAITGVNGVNFVATAKVHL